MRRVVLFFFIAALVLSPISAMAAAAVPVGNLIVHKDLQGEYGDWGVDGDTVFWVKVYDDNGLSGHAEQLVFKAAPEADGSYYCVGNTTAGVYEYYGTAYSGSVVDEVQFSKNRPVTLSNIWKTTVYSVQEINEDEHCDVSYGVVSMPPIGDSEVTVTNTYYPYEHETGRLIIHKTLEGDYSAYGTSASTVFNAKVKDSTNDNYLVFRPVPELDGSYWCVGNNEELSDPDLKFAYPDTYDDESEIQDLIDSGIILDRIPFSAGKSAMLSNLWADPTEYKVEEIAGAGYTVSYTGNDVTITSSQTAVVTVKNKYPDAVSPVTGGLKIEKILAGGYAGRGVDNSTAFTAKIEVGSGQYMRLSGTGPNYTCVGADDTGTEITFSKSGPVTIMSIPAGTVCNVREDGAAYCDASYSGADTTISDGVTSVVRVTNTYTDAGGGRTRPSVGNDPPAGDDPQSGDEPAGGGEPGDNGQQYGGDNPGGDGASEFIEPPGGDDRDVPPRPYASGRTVVAGENGAYIELGDDGVPLGEWQWDDEQARWIFDEYPPLSDINLPQTGFFSLSNPIFVIIGSLILLGVLILLGFSLLGVRGAIRAMKDHGR